MTDPTRQVKITNLADVHSERMRWAWAGILPLNSTTLFGGRGDVGKSTFALHIAGLATHGRLDGDLHGIPVDVLIVSHEDPLAAIVKPRAIANGVDVTRLHHFAIEDQEVGGVTVPKLPLDALALREAIRTTNARIVIVDPVTSTLEGDNDKVHDVRAVLDTLAAIGEEMGVTFICIAHFRKGTSGSASDFISGSHAYRDAVRALLLFARDKEAGETVVSLEKGNYTNVAPNFAYRIDPTTVDTDDGDRTSVGRIVMLGTTDRSVADVVAAEGGPNYGALRADILAFIRHAPGAVSTAEILAEFPEPEFKATTIRSNLSRLAKAGAVTTPIRGFYSTPHQPQMASGSGDPEASTADVAPPSRAATSATTATSTPDIAHVADVAPPRARGSATFNDDEPGYCRHGVTLGGRCSRCGGVAEVRDVA